MVRHASSAVASHILLWTSCILSEIQPPTMLALYWCRPTPDHNSLATTTPSTDAGSTWDLRHHTDPEHAPAFRHLATIDPPGDPTLKFQTGSMVRPELMSHQRPESVRDNRSRRGHIIHTRSHLPHRSLANPVCRRPHMIPDPVHAERRTAILRMWLACRTCPNLRSTCRVHIGSGIPPLMRLSPSIRCPISDPACSHAG